MIVMKVSDRSLGRAAGGASGARTQVLRPPALARACSETSPQHHTIQIETICELVRAGHQQQLRKSAQTGELWRLRAHPSSSMHCDLLRSKHRSADYFRRGTRRGRAQVRRGQSLSPLPGDTHAEADTTSPLTLRRDPARGDGAHAPSEGARRRARKKRLGAVFRGLKIADHPHLSFEPAGAAPTAPGAPITYAAASAAGALASVFAAKLLCFFRGDEPEQELETRTEALSSHSRSARVAHSSHR